VVSKDKDDEGSNLRDEATNWKQQAMILHKLRTAMSLTK
jgi:hypothetical protein